MTTPPKQKTIKGYVARYAMTKAIQKLCKAAPPLNPDQVSAVKVLKPLRTSQGA